MSATVTTSSRSSSSSASPPTPSSAAPTSAPASGTSIAGGAERGERPRASSTTRSGRCGRPTTSGSSSRFVVLWTAFSEAFASITLTLFVPLTLAALGIVLRGSSFAFRKAVLRTRDQRNFGAAFAVVVGPRAVLHGRRRRRHRLRACPGRRGGGRPVVELDQPDVDPRRRPGGHGVRLPRRRLPRVGRAPCRRRRDGRVLPAPRRGRGRRRRRGRVRRHLRPPRRRPLRLRRADLAGTAVRDRLGVVRRRIAGAAATRRASAGRRLCPSARSRRSSSVGASPNGRTCCRRA